MSNGVQGYNQTAINVCYAGGIKNVGGKMVAVDNRTERFLKVRKYFDDFAAEALKESGSILAKLQDERE